MADHPRPRGRWGTILLTTQYLEEADQLADRVAILDGGRLVAECTPQELKRRVPGGHVRFRFHDAAGLAAAAGAHAEAVGDHDSLTLTIPSDGSIASLRDLFGSLAAEDNAVERVAVHTPDLDDVFLALTGHASDHDKELVP